MEKQELNVFPANDPHLVWQGRTVEDPSGNRYLIGSASSLKFRFQGNDCKVRMLNSAPMGEYNYVSFVVDGIHQQRLAIKVDTFFELKIPVSNKADFHDVELYKETEASNGFIVISQILTEAIIDFPLTVKKKIEYIGDSVTAGMASDTSLVDCEQGTWYDQHNAYDAYGPRIARELNLDYMIVAVSGIGAYRNWNTDYPVMSDVYESAFLTANSNYPKWDFKKFIPDVVAICLGTNDFSEGDGVTPRLPFDSTQFINRYVDLISKVHHHYPEAKILLLRSPIAGMEHDMMYKACLETVKQKTASSMNGLNSISIFSFTSFFGSGCTGHPSLDDHAKMAKELVPVIRENVKM